MTKKLTITAATAALLVVSMMPVLAEETVALPKKTGQLDTACVKTAIEKRETAIATMFGESSAAITNALVARKASTLAAWNEIDKKLRREALKTTAGQYRAAIKKARADLRTGRNAAWKDFKTVRKACGAGAMDDPVNQGLDEQL